MAVTTDDLCIDCGGPRVQPGRHSYKLRCLNCYNRARYAANPERQRRVQIKHRYGLSADEYLKLLDEQDGACGICGALAKSAFELGVDHDHRCCPGQKSCGACVRGLLCDPCNSAIGLLRDSPEVLRLAAGYLESRSVA